MRAHQRWTQAEIELLLDQAKVIGITALAKKFDRSTSSISSRLLKCKVQGTQAGGRAWKEAQPKITPEWTEEKIAVVLKYQPLAYRAAYKAYRLSQYRVPLDDLRGEAILTLVNAALRLDMSRSRTGSPMPYLSMLLWHAMLSYRKLWCTRAHIQGTCFSALGDRRDESESRAYDPEDARERNPAEQAEMRLDMEQLRSSLSPNLKKFFDLRMSNLTHVQIGREMGITRQRVEQLQKQLIERGRKVLGVAVNEDV